MKKHISYFLIFPILGLLSCSSMKVVEYKITHNPNIQFIDSIPVTMVYNVDDVLVKNNGTNLDIDSEIGEHIYSSLSEKIRSESKHNTIYNHIMQSATGTKLNKAQVADICNKTDKANIVSLNGVEISSYYRTGTIDEDWHIVDLFVPVKVHISALIPDKDSIISYVAADTLVFSGAGYSQKEAIESLPTTKICNKKIVESITDVASAQYLAKNKKVARLYFVSTKPMMRKADKFWRKGMYSEASYIWEYLYENKNSKILQSKTAANLALYEELNQNFEKALMWARISFALCSRKKSVYDPEIAYLSDYIQQLRLNQREQQYFKCNTSYKFE